MILLLARRFIGREKERDTGTGLDYFGARYYDSEAGRWMSVDPLAHLRPGLSPYNYVQNNPLNRYDPDGQLDFSRIKDKYPKAYNALKEIDRRITQRMIDAWGDYGQASTKDIFKALYPGRGPIIAPENLSTYGLYDNKNRPNELQIDEYLFEEFEKGNIPYILLEAVILHELTHYFDLKDGKLWKDGKWEAGHAFETWVYGKPLDEWNTKKDDNKKKDESSQQSGSWYDDSWWYDFDPSRK